MGLHNIVEVSVPLRGKGSRKFNPFDALSNNAYVWFPSPCGVKVVGNLNETAETLTRDIAGVSVPLRGKGSRKFDSMASEAGLLTVFPSPCGVKVVGNYKSIP